MDYLRTTVPLLTKASGESGVIEGYASTWGYSEDGSPDLVGDIVARGAFTKSLEKHAKAGTMPALLASHDQKEPIGRWLELREDDHGLFAVGRLVMTVQRAREVFDLCREGAMALSIGFTPVKSHMDGDVRVLDEVRLGEISLVGLAANPQAKITAVKSLDSVRDYEKHLRESFGLSVREAKRLSMGGWKEFRGSEETDLALLADMIEASAKHWRKKR